MPSYIEQIRGDREAVMIQEKMRIVGHDKAVAYAVSQRDRRERIKQVVIGVIASLCGFAFGVLVMLAAVMR